MRSYRTLSEVIEEYLRKHPDEIDSFVSVVFEEYAEDGDIAATLSTLEIVSRVKGISQTTENDGTSWREVQQALAEDGDAKFGEVNALMHAMGYRLVPQKLQASTGSRPAEENLTAQETPQSSCSDQASHAHMSQDPPSYPTHYASGF